MVRTATHFGLSAGIEGSLCQLRSSGAGIKADQLHGQHSKGLPSYRP